MSEVDDDDITNLIIIIMLLTTTTSSLGDRSDVVDPPLNSSSKTRTDSLEVAFLLILR